MRAVADEVAPIGPNGPLPVIRVIGPTPSGSTLSLARRNSDNHHSQGSHFDKLYAFVLHFKASSKIGTNFLVASPF